MQPIWIEIGLGDLVDRITILEIKLARILTEAKRDNVRIELESLTTARDRAIPPSVKLAAMALELRAVNERLWDLEDRVRELEDRRAFNADFIAAARAIYHTNDERAAIKRRINEAFESRIVEEKSYGRPDSDRREIE